MILGRAFVQIGIPFLSVLMGFGATAQTEFNFTLSGSQENPPVDTLAQGLGIVTLNAARTEIIITVDHNVANATASYIHLGAEGVNGDIVLDLGDPASPIMSSVDSLTSEDVANLMAGNYYVNVLSGANPAGEIRGQVVADPSAEIRFEFTLSGSQENPPVDTLAQGLGIVTLNAARTEIIITVDHNVANATASYIHLGAEGVNGDIVLDLGDPASPIMSSVDSLTSEVVANLMAGNYYVNVLSGANPAGEIRGQVVASAASGEGEGEKPGCAAASEPGGGGLWGDIAVALLVLTGLLGATMWRRAQRVA